VNVRERIERLALLKSLAQAVGRHPDCPEAERARAVHRVHQYTDEMNYYERQYRR
jgi:hypothetical protein